jgi:pimeloyl-ACP methyl ester carboxylesterase
VPIKDPRTILGKRERQGGSYAQHSRWARWLARLSVAALVTITVDVGSGLVFHTQTTSSVLTLAGRSGVTDRAFVILPGYVMSGRITARAFYPFMGSTDGIIGVDYAQRGIDTAEIYGRIRNALRTLHPRRVVLYGASMGGQIAADIAQRLGKDDSSFGHPVLVLDSAPRVQDDIRRPSWLFWMSCHFSGGVISSLLWAGVSSLETKPPVSASSSDVASEAWHYGTWVGMPALTSQGCYLSKARSLMSSPNTLRVVFLTGENPDRDPLIRIPRAITHWKSTYPQMIVITVRGRDAKWHLPLAEQPSATVAALLDTSTS